VVRPDNRALVFSRSGSGWEPQRPALTSKDVPKDRWFGYTVALSADGETAVIGGEDAAWVFAREDSTWTPQVSKLTPTDIPMPDGFGMAVAVAADGDTALISSWRGNATSLRSGTQQERQTEGVWVFVRAGSHWTQQAKLVGTDADRLDPRRPYRVALSAAGDFALIGGNGNDNSANTSGAVWAFSRSGSSWTQVGPKILPTSSPGRAFGDKVALSTDAGTALIAGASAPRASHPGGSIPGRVWALDLHADGFTWQGSPLTLPADRSGFHATALALSGNGRIALIRGGSTAWIFSR
jgi:hypothetical protein